MKRLLPLEDSLLIPDYTSYDDDGVRVHALTPTALERLRMLPIAIRATPRLRRRFEWQMRRFGYRFFRSVYLPKLRALIRGKDVVHSVTGDYLGWAALEAARAENVPFVLSVFIHPGQYGEDADNVSFYKQADIVVGLVEAQRRRLVELGVAPERIRVSRMVPLLAESSDGAGFRTRYGLGERPVVLFLGRLAEYKGPLAILRSAPQVWERFPNVQFLFAGPADDDAKRWFRERGDRRIRYLGVISEQGRQMRWPHATCSACRRSTRHWAAFSWRHGALARPWLAARRMAPEN